MEEEKNLLVKNSPLARLTESPEKAVELLNSVKTNFSRLLKANKEIIIIPTKQGKKEYVRYEGWVTIATVMGIMPRIITLTKIDKGFQAYAEAVYIRTGQVVGSAYGICSKDEGVWAQRPDFSIAAMAQTRAAARALKTILGGVITHIGFEGTPAELADDENLGEDPANAARATFNAKELEIWDIGDCSRFGANKDKAEALGRRIKNTYDKIGHEKFAKIIGDLGFGQVSEITNMQSLTTFVNAILEGK